MNQNSPSPPSATKPSMAAYIGEQLQRALLNPVRAMKWTYLPLLMVYFAYGATGLIAIAQTFWVKKALTLTPADLASLAVWLNIPWTVKMVIGELVDTVSVFGSRRRGYVLIGGGLVAAGMLMLAAAASGMVTSVSPNVLYVAASLVMVIGLVLQDVVADAMSTEVVPRLNADGSPRAKEDIDRELGMVQVLGRLALSLGAFATAGVAGFLASALPYSTVFLLGLIVPLISVSGAMLVNLETPERRAIDWQTLGGGLAFGAFVLTMGLGQVPFGAEIVFAVSLAVVVTMLHRVAGHTPPETRAKIAIAAILIFLFRAAPSAGSGYSWFTMDVLGFDEAFLGTLAQIGAGLALVAAWLLSDAITRQPVARVLLWLVIVGAIVSLPGLGLTLGLHNWTEAMFGFGARSIAIVDAAAASPLAQISMVPMLTLIAIHAPPGHRAIWFALMASLMNLAISAGELQTKYLNLLFAVDRGAYGNLPWLYGTALFIGTVVPLAAIWVLGRRLR